MARATRNGSQNKGESQSGSNKTQVEGLVARKMAAERLREVIGGHAFEPFGEAQIADARSRALTNRLVTQALRRHAHLSIILSDLASKGMPKRSGIFEFAIRIGLTELLFLDGADHAAVFLAVELVRKDRRAGRYVKLANGILRQAQRDAARWQELPKVDALLPDVRAQIKKQHGEPVAEAVGEALLEGAALDLTARGDAKFLAEKVGGEAINSNTVRVTERDRPVTALPGFAEGEFIVQDIAAALPATLFSLPKGAKVLDLCAAPGGKTVQLCLMGYEVIAVDVDEHRLARVKENLDRLGLSAELVCADALQLDETATYDGILLDAPCSATGTFRRHPEVLINREKGDIDRFVSLQRRMIEKSSRLLSSGGQLVFSTCSLDQREGEEHLEWIKEKSTAFEISPVGNLETGLEGAVAKGGYVRTHPGLSLTSDSANAAGHGRKSQFGMDGFFAARFERV